MKLENIYDAMSRTDIEVELVNVTHGRVLKFDGSVFTVKMLDGDAIQTEKEAVAVGAFTGHYRALPVLPVRSEGFDGQAEVTAECFAEYLKEKTND